MLNAEVSEISEEGFSGCDIKKDETGFSLNFAFYDNEHKEQHVSPGFRAGKRKYWVLCFKQEWMCEDDDSSEGETTDKLVNKVPKSSEQTNRENVSLGLDSDLDFPEVLIPERHVWTVALSFGHHCMYKGNLKFRPKKLEHWPYSYSILDMPNIGSCSSILIKMQLMDSPRNMKAAVFQFVLMQNFEKHPINVKIHIEYAKKVSDNVLEMHCEKANMQLLSLLDRKMFSDVVLSVNGHSIFAHRHILAIYSPVFKAMFENEMSEQKSGVVTINDLEPKSVEEMVKFMYSPGIPQVQRVPLIIGIFKAAHKYNIESLEKICSGMLINAIDVGNVLDILHLAGLSMDHELKKEAVDFISKNPKSVSDMQKCCSIMLDCPELFQYLLLNCSIRDPEGKE